MKNIVAIHQPNFFPWLGYFEKIARSDFFIFLDNVQFPKTGGSWSNRVKLLISGKPNWVTATVDRNYNGTRNINEMYFQTLNSPWQDKMMKSLENCYKRHPYYHEVISVIEPLVRNKETNVAEYNIHAIVQIAELLKIDLKKIKRSSFIQVQGSSNELLCALTTAVGGRAYMCGGGADGYQDEEIFRARGIKLIYQSFQHPIYSQKDNKDFVPGLSIIDALMNVGPQHVHELLNRTYYDAIRTF
jgi:hypothetical protein